MNSVRSVPVTGAGEGVEILFRNSDVRRLFNEFGVNYSQVLTDGLARQDVDVIEKAMAIGLKKNGQPFDVKFDDLDMPVADLAERLLDGYYLSAFGRSYLDHVTWVVAQMEKQQAGKPDETLDSPPPSPGATSAGSIEPPTGRG